jgi:hypothetical protein
MVISDVLPVHLFTLPYISSLDISPQAVGPPAKGLHTTERAKTPGETDEGIGGRGRVSIAAIALLKRIGSQDGTKKRRRGDELWDTQITGVGKHR